MATRSKENRTYCQRLFDVVDVVIDHPPAALTLDLVRLLLYNPAAQHGEFLVWEAEHGDFLGRVFFSRGFKVPTKDLGVELLGWADVNGTVHQLAPLHDGRLLVTRERVYTHHEQHQWILSGPSKYSRAWVARKTWYRALIVLERESDGRSGENEDR